MPTIEEQEPLTYFFLSYARMDLDAYLSRFFRDLADEVEKQAKLGRELRFQDLNGELESREKLDSFRDLDNIKLGDRWPDVLAKALQSSRVLVAMCSIQYFLRPYCGKEVQVFLERHRASGGTGAEKIIPLFWFSAKKIGEDTLPPAIRKIQYKHADLPEDYFEKGLRIMARNRRTSYTLFVEAVAQRIVELAEKEPLPPLLTPPDLQKMRSAFEEAATSELRAEVAEGPRVVHLLFLAEPLPMEAPPLGDAVQAAPWHWRPFGADSPEIIDLVDAVLSPSLASRGLRVTGVGSLRAALGKSNTLGIVVVDHTFLRTAEGRAVLVSVLNDVDAGCGVLITYDEREAGAAAIRADLDQWLQLDSRDKAKLVEIVGSDHALHDALSKMLLELQQGAVENGQVHRMANGEGPTKPPLLNVPGKVS